MFEGRILKYTTNTVGGDSLFIITTFSKNKIISHRDAETGKPYPDPAAYHSNRVLGTYTFDKPLNDKDEKVFQVTIQGNTYDIELDWFNKFKCNWLHQRYVINKDAGEWFIKTIITTIVAALLSLLSLWIGYRQGHQAGLKEGQSQSQDTTQQRLR